MYDIATPYDMRNVSISTIWSPYRGHVVQVCGLCSLTRMRPLGRGIRRGREEAKKRRKEGENAETKKRERGIADHERNSEATELAVARPPSAWSHRTSGSSAAATWGLPRAVAKDHIVTKKSITVMSSAQTVKASFMV